MKQLRILSIAVLAATLSSIGPALAALCQSPGSVPRAQSSLQSPAADVPDIPAATVSGTNGKRSSGP